jgi:hypothetical protein
VIWHLQSTVHCQLSPVRDLTWMLHLPPAQSYQEWLHLATLTGGSEKTICTVQRIENIAILLYS